MKYLLYGISLFYLFTSWQCASRSISGKAPLKFATLSHWPTFYQENYRRIQSVKSEARISLESPAMASNVTVDLIFRGPDTLFMRAEGFLGMDLGKILIAKERFILFNQFNNQFIAGRLDDPHYNLFLEINLSIQQLKNAFIGFAPLPADLTLLDEKEGLFVSYTNQQEQRYKVNKENGSLEWLEIYQGDQLILKQEFKNYFSSKGLLFPRLTRIILPPRKEMVAIFHKNIKINEAIDKNSYFIEIGSRTRQLFIDK